MVMTHNELLKYLNERLSWENGTETGNAYSALLTIVGLHKEYASPNIFDDKTVCMHCTQNEAVYYPCLTIKVIEKELK
jgi:hypothetical protein